MIRTKVETCREICSDFMQIKDLKESVQQEAIIQLRMVQIPKFCCLKSSTNIWLSVGTINSIPKVKKK